MVDDAEDDILLEEDVSFDDLSADLDGEVDSGDLDDEALDSGDLDAGLDDDDEEGMVDETVDPEDVDPDAELAADFGDEFDATGAGLPPTATFDVDDDDEDDSGPVIERDEDDDEDGDGDEDDAVREGEFVCRSCFMAKRESALGDEERSLCLDCV